MSLEILNDPKVDAFLDAIIVFAISLIAELISLPGLPTFDAAYHALLVSLLAFFIFYAKKRGLDNYNTRNNLE